MRALVFTTLKDIPAIAQDCDGRFYASGTLGIGNVPANPDRPYCMYTQLPANAYQEVRKTSTATLRFFQFYVYDDRGDFARIDNILAAVRETIPGLVDKVDTSNGATCIEAIWTGESPDIADDQHDTNVKFGSFQLTSTK